MESKEMTTLTGQVEAVVYQNEATGFTVLELDCGGELVTAVGEMPGVAVGEHLRLIGEYTTHASFGDQFKVVLCERELPATAAAIQKYLASGVIKGIGPTIASRIVRQFGDETLEILEKQPKRLTEVRGVSPQKAMAFGEAFGRLSGIRTVMAYLARFNVQASYCVRVFRRWGQLATDMINENPYLLCDDEIGVDFDTADLIATQLGLGRDGQFRIGAGAAYVLRHNIQNGHTCLPIEKLVSVAADLLEVEEEKVEAAIGRCCEDKTLMSARFSGRDYIYLPPMFEAERFSAGRVRMMGELLSSPPGSWDGKITALERELGIEYEGLQRGAIDEAMRCGVLVLTGGPGTGKTTTLNGIIRLLKDGGKRVLIAAPTGRAAKRVTELTGYDAKTIHRLLEVQFSAGGDPQFSRNEKNPLEADVVILDEVSMVDIRLFESLLRALPLGCKLILVGDSDQLPPIGAGSLLRDLIDSEMVPVVELKQVFRQAAQSLIVLNAHAIVQGEMPDLRRRDSDFFHFPLGFSGEAAELIRDLCTRRLPGAYDLSPLWDIQVIAPGHGGELGTKALNQMLQAALNPPEKGKVEIHSGAGVLRLGDKVMQIRNNYDIPYRRDDGERGAGIFNGDIGVIEEIEKGAGLMVVRFDDRLADYPIEMVRELELAYAITVHKSQGSEFEAVILPLQNMRSRLYYRNLLYTAVTRARRLLILIANPETVWNTVENVRRSLRYTHLKEMIRGEMETDV